jgi:hypothetical protein
MRKADGAITKNNKQQTTMKRILNLIVLMLFLSAILESCDNELSLGNDVCKTESPQEPQKEVPCVTLTQDEMILLAELSKETPKISQEEAMGIANSFLNKGDLSTSLSKHGTSVPRCEVLTRAKRNISKAGTTTEDVDTLLYVFNYDNGYAVVSADVRVPEQILAFSDEGTLHLDSYDPYINMFRNLAEDYVDNNILNAELIKDSVENTLMEKILTSLGIEADTAKSLSKAKRVVQKLLLTNECGPYEQYASSEEIGPYLKTYWGQWSPFNDSVPLDTNGCECPAGCTPIAITQLMAYWKYPICYDDGARINWNSITKEKKKYTATDRVNVADFVYKVGSAIGTNYSSSGSGAYLEDGVEFLKTHGYYTNGVIKYSAPDVRNSIDKKRPIAIAGYHIAATDTSGAKNGHTWLIDGYAKIKYNTGNKITYAVIFVDDATGRQDCEFEVIYSPTGSNFKYYHHFNLGWGKTPSESSTGYYYESVFDVKNECKIYSDREPGHISNSYGAHNYQYSIIIATDIHI